MNIYGHILYINYICLYMFMYIYIYSYIKNFLPGIISNVISSEKYFKFLYSQYIKTKKRIIKNKISFSFCPNNLHAE